MTETHTPLPYECFQDRSYYDMWCVRRVNEREWGKGFHLVNGEEAAALRDMLNTRADSHHRLVEALEAERTWHEDHDKAISKQPNANTGDNGWRRMEHQERIAEITAALKEAGR